MRRTLLIALLIPHLILLSAGCASSAADLNAGGVTFEQRCAQPAVVKCFGFDAPEKTDRFIFPPYGTTVKRARVVTDRSEEHTSELQSRRDLVCRLLLEKKKRR